MQQKALEELKEQSRKGSAEKRQLRSSPRDYRQDDRSRGHLCKIRFSRYPLLGHPADFAESNESGDRGDA